MNFQLILSLHAALLSNRSLSVTETFITCPLGPLYIRSDDELHLLLSKETD